MEAFQGIELTPLTRKLLAKYCEKTQEKPEDVVLRALTQLLEKQESTEPKEEEIEYENVMLRVPKKIMDFMRSIPQSYPGPVEWLEYTIVDNVRADLEGMTGQEVITMFDLESIFGTVLGDKRFVSL